MTTLPQLEKLDLRVPGWSLDLVEHRRCPLCDLGREASLKRPDGLPVAYCPGCALWDVSALPPEAEIIWMYQGYWRSFRPRISQRPMHMEP